jgi:hypothetical protein
MDTSVDYSWLKDTLSNALSIGGSIELAKVNAENRTYQQGQPVVTAPAMGINPMYLLIGAAVLLVVMLKD